MLSDSERVERDNLTMRQLQALIDRYESEIARIEREIREIQNRAQGRPTGDALGHIGGQTHRMDG